MDLKFWIDTGWIATMVLAALAIAQTIQDAIRMARGKTPVEQMLAREIAYTGLAGGILLTVLELIAENAGLI